MWKKTAEDRSHLPPIGFCVFDGWWTYASRHVMFSFFLSSFFLFLHIRWPWRPSPAQTFTIWSRNASTYSAWLLATNTVGASRWWRRRVWEHRAVTRERLSLFSVFIRKWKRCKRQTWCSIADWQVNPILMLSGTGTELSCHFIHVTTITQSEERVTTRVATV